MDKKKRDALYKSIAKRSFETKLNLYLFSLALFNKDNLPELDDQRFKKFKINDELVKKYTAEYWQTERDKMVGGILVDDIYKWMKGFKENNKSAIEQIQTNYIGNFNQIFSEIDFENLVKEESCLYCGITIKDLEKLAESKKNFKKNERGWSLEIDRKDSNLEYTKENCVMSCYWCNNAKTDEFTAEEFALIGNAIAQVWYERLKKSNISGDFDHLKK